MDRRTPPSPRIELADLPGRRTLIVGEVNSGKTHLSRLILLDFLSSGAQDIAVLDWAPERIGGVGGTLVPPKGSGVLYRRPAISAPRLTGAGEAGAEELARRNAAAIDADLDEYLQAPREILFINDASMYLHEGRFERLLEVIGTSRTTVLNAYRGSSFPEGSLSRRERCLVERLTRHMDRIVDLGS